MRPSNTSRWKSHPDVLTPHHIPTPDTLTETVPLTGHPNVSSPTHPYLKNTIKASPSKQNPGYPEPPHAKPITRHPDTRHQSPNTHNPSPITHHASPITHHLLIVTPTGLLTLWMR
eukprot:564771-Amorphochlora_amoeboformis.AAC.1